MRKVKSEICRACSELLEEAAFMPEELPDDIGSIIDSILSDIRNATTGVEIVKRRYGTADNTRKN